MYNEIGSMGGGGLFKRFLYLTLEKEFFLYVHTISRF